MYCDLELPIYHFNNSFTNNIIKSKSGVIDYDEVEH